jgi:predicted ArsR family transcriptional regulator
MSKHTIPPCRYDAPARATVAAEAYIAKRSAPVYLGEVALELNLSLSQALKVLNVLVASGSVEALSNNEKAARGIDACAAVYVYVQCARFR